VLLATTRHICILNSEIAKIYHLVVAKMPFGEAIAAALAGCIAACMTAAEEGEVVAEAP
jgi:hypothetical protein